MTRLPDRERILNAYAAGFAPSWIAQRFKKNASSVQSVLQYAREKGDPRAKYYDKSTHGHRRYVSTFRKYIESGLVRGHDINEAVVSIDQFPDLPEISEPMLPFGGRIPQAVGEP
jgi:hypothetical protein